MPAPHKKHTMPPKRSPKELIKPYKKKLPRFSNRIDLRLESELKDLFLKAAALSGSNGLSNYIVSTVRDRSIQLLEEHERLLLSNKDWELVLSLLENPPQPNAALLRARKSHKKLISE